MADKDKKKLKVILKLPPKSSSTAQPKSSPASAAGGGAKAAAAAHASAGAAGGFTFSGSATGSSHQFPPGLQDQQKQHRSSSSSKNHLQAGRHGVLLQGATAAGPAAGASSSGPTLFHTAGSFSSVRSSGNSSAGGPSSSSAAPAPAAAAGGGGRGLASFLHLSSPPGSSSHPPTPPKKRKFKTVEHAGGLGVGAVVVGRSAGFGSATASEGPGSGRDGGGAAGGPPRFGSGGGGGGTGAGGKGGHGGGRDAGGRHGGGKEAGGREGDVGGGVPGGGRTGLPQAPIAPFPLKKSHKKQVKPSVQTDGPQAHNPFAGVIMPEKTPSELLSKTMLEGVLEKLQKKDTYAVFAEPVDATQVPDYYDIIKEPMDFGTMRKKIKKGSYKTMEEFEGDIYLVCSNAMRYNGPDTIYYKQARAIREMARKALEGIRVQLAGDTRKPVSHKKKQSPSSKKSHTKKPTLSKMRLDGTGSDFTSGATLAGDGEHSRGWSNSIGDTNKVKIGLSAEKLAGLGEDSQDAWVPQPVGKEGKSETQEEPSGALLKPMGPKDGRRPLSTEEYHRNTYKQRLLPAHGQGPPLVAVGGEGRQLVPVGNQVEHAYAKSLAKFGAGLGPRAWHFIAKRLELLNAPTVQPRTTNGSLAAEKMTAPVLSQAGATTNSHPADSQSYGIGGDIASSPSQSGQVVDAVANRASGVALSGQVVDSTPRVPLIVSNVGTGIVSTPSIPTEASRVPEALVSIPSKSAGISQVGEALVSSQNYPFGGSQIGQALVSASKIPSGGAKSAVSAPNHPSGSSQAAVSFPYAPSDVGQALGSNLSSSGPSQGPSASPSLNSSGPSHGGQALGFSFSSSGPLHVVQNPTNFPVGGTIGPIDRTPAKTMRGSSQQGGGSSDTQQERGNGRLENAPSDPGSDSLVHTSGSKQILGLDSDSASEEQNARRHGWTPVSGVDQVVSGLAIGAASKAFSQAWSATPLEHGSTSYAYAPIPSSAGRDESNAQAQAWAQARVMSLTNSADAKRNLSRDAQVLAFISQNRELPSDLATNLPQILQSAVYADFNSRPRQSSVLSSAAPSTQDQRPEAFGNKLGAPEQMGSSPGLHSQGNLRPAPLQQSSLQQRAMPPDLNVALLSPSALQSPPPPQGSTPTGARHPDLKLQL